jgi:anti-repressor protein
MEDKMKDLDMESLKKVSNKMLNDAVDKDREDKSKELQILDIRDVFGRAFKIYGDVENPIFLAEDVAEAIEHSKTNMMLESLDDDEKFMRKIYITSDKSEASDEVDDKPKETMFTSGQFRDMWFLTENGVLELLTKSRKLKAKQLKLTIEEILTDIRDKKTAEIRAESKGFLSMIFDGKDIRMTVIDGEVWWVLKDVCGVLDIDNSRDVASRLDDDEKGVGQIYTNKGSQDIIIINESGLYNVIFRSDKPVAREFRRWVTHEILPEIRKHGYYMTNAKIADVVNDPDAFVKELEEKNERLIADLEAEREEKEQVIEEKKQLQLEAKKNEPKVNFANAMSVSMDLILLREFCKMLMSYGIDIGQNRLFQWLREHGYLIKKIGSDYNTPMQSAMDMGLFQIKESYVYRSGEIKLVRTTYLTIKGQVYFLDKFLKEFQVEE